MRKSINMDQVTGGDAACERFEARPVTSVRAPPENARQDMVTTSDCPGYGVHDTAGCGFSRGGPE
jgi:hypothetical protein